MRSSRAAPGWGTLMTEARDVIEAVRARGVDVAADVYPYTAGGTGMEATIPSWAHEGGRDSLRARQGRPAVRERLKREIETGSPGWWNIVEASGGWENVVLVNARTPKNARYEGRDLSEVADMVARDPAEPPSTWHTGERPGQVLYGPGRRDAPARARQDGAALDPRSDDGAGQESTPVQGAA